MILELKFWWYMKFSEYFAPLFLKLVINYCYIGNKYLLGIFGLCVNLCVEVSLLSAKALVGEER